MMPDLFQTLVRAGLIPDGDLGQLSDEEQAWMLATQEQQTQSTQLSAGELVEATNALFR